jgi:hypothetical protein
MPKRINPQDQWETDFQVPLPGEPRNIGPLETLFQRLLNRTERLKNRIAAILGTAWDATPPDTLAGLARRVNTLESNQGGTTLSAHRNASVLDHPDGSVTTTKLADGAVTLAKLASAILGQPNGIPLLNSAGALASANAYLNRGSLSSAVDWNTITTAGVYAVYSQAFGDESQNTPPTAYRYGTLLVLASGPSSAVIVQIYVPHHTDRLIYFRQYFSSWSPWHEAGGYYGSNSNGSYIRFGDGVQICWAVSTGNGPSPKTITYPAAFSSTPAPLVTLRDIVPGYATVDGRTSDSTQLTVLKYNPDGTAYTGSYLAFGYIAIGRWK